MKPPSRPFAILNVSIRRTLPRYVDALFTVRTRLMEPSKLAGRMSGEVDHPAGDVDRMVTQALVKPRHQRQFHCHRI
jgi:hypothetical protein